MRSILFSFVLISLSLISCKKIQEAVKRQSPYEEYREALRKAGLKDAALTQAWLAAGEAALTDSVQIELPFSESGYLAAEQPDARSYRFTAKAGQVLSVKLKIQAAHGTRIFVDLFVWEDNAWQPLVHADSSLRFRYEFEEIAQCLLRIQPELLAELHYHVELNLTPALRNPVQGADNRSIQSFYGAARDGGRRSHEGLDIFAPRGTPVLAPVSGRVNRVGNNRLGGKVVWLRDRERKLSYYFAHLDSQLVSSGTRVDVGDTLGLVGNTGNARSTPPHLHFGIYRHGSRDPLGYVQTLPSALPQAAFDSSLWQEKFVTRTQKANVRTGPGTRFPVIRSLEQRTPVQTLARHGSWYRVRLPDGRQAYLAASLLEKMQPHQQIQLDTLLTLFSAPHEQAIPIRRLQPATRAQVLAVFSGFRYIQLESGERGWINK
jgi:murein DD-endopeptidase MepM/ murein hydrolase activator NlpD